MTEATGTTEVETVTVEFAELKANIHHYYELKKTKRLVVIKDGEQFTVLGRWLPDERRTWFPHWPELLDEMFPDPIDPEDPEPDIRFWEEIRGHRPAST